MVTRRTATLAALAFAINFTAAAQIQLPAVLSDHMVLQDGQPVPLWGKATPSATVTAVFAGQTVRTQADSNGYWMLHLKPLAISSNGADLSLSEASGPPVVIHDVLVGEVWVAGGQSNMAFSMSSMEGKEPYLAAPANPQIRLFNVKHAVAAEPIGLHPGDLPGDVSGRWEIADAKSIASFSAVAYLFGKELQQKLGRPVGLISSNWGGTPIQTWMSLDALKSDPALGKDLDAYNKDLALHRQLIADPQNDAKFQAEWKQWRKEVGDVQDAKMKAWLAAQAIGQDVGPKPVATRPEPKNPDPMGLPLGGYRPNSPAISWNAMFAPIIPFAAKGALWYQGEANISQWRTYSAQLKAMVPDWRRKFGEPEMEFIVVQLPGNGKSEVPKHNLAHMREAQATVLDLPHTGLAITYDVGDPNNVHPASKVDVGHRLAVIALAESYGQKVPFTGPRVKSIMADGSAIKVTFTGFSGKLHPARQPWLAANTEPYPSDKLIGFEIAGGDQVFHPADATISGDTVTLTAADVSSPKFVRYAFDESPRANLYDDAGLPAAPFRNDKQ